MAYMKERLHPGATRMTKQAKTLQVALPRDLELKKVFLALYSRDTAAIGGFAFAKLLGRRSVWRSASVLRSLT